MRLVFFTPWAGASITNQEIAVFKISNGDLLPS